ncbi:MAG TPA: isoprenylcysteine carboxylmethyltransferase family protein [Rhizomicrobium sp.]|jgi:protein-S-isoprenylcysteine O-methyltransferase Ste14|nr:isoprenylcysteine carboxylmethyltransferase family protein [Rhizomicrobium sp.]
MRRMFAGLGALLFFFIAPGTVAGLVPWWIAGGRMNAPFLGTPATRIVGVLLVVAGLVPLVESFFRFVMKGLGTPAPVFPTQHLVVSGFYCHVRNPMYVGVFAVILGDALVLGSRAVLGYALLVWLGFFLFVLLYEEPTLRRSFGAEYEDFCRHVPRWLPRLTPWRGG